jgi:CMP-N-acetylneuraminic acid synthetase
MFRVDPAGYLEPFMKEQHPQPYLLRRQDLPDCYYYNCIVDVTRPHTIFELNSMTGNRMRPYYIDPEDAFDIDTKRDLEIARIFSQDFPCAD